MEKSEKKKSASAGPLCCHLVPFAPMRILQALPVFQLEGCTHSPRLAGRHPLRLALGLRWNPLQFLPLTEVSRKTSSCSHPPHGNILRHSGSSLPLGAERSGCPKRVACSRSVARTPRFIALWLYLPLHKGTGRPDEFDSILPKKSCSLSSSLRTFVRWGSDRPLGLGGLTLNRSPPPSHWSSSPGFPVQVATLGP
jgi:hypothetical protein